MFLRKLLKRGLSGMVIPCPVDTRFHQKAVRVAILGANTYTGEMLAYLLKQNPIVSQIYLFGDSSVFGISADLRHFDTRSRVKAYCGREGLSKSLRRADIVVLVGSDKCSTNADHETRLRSELDNVVMYADACTKYAPKSLIAVCVRPVSTTMPIVSDIFRNTHWYHPGRIIGSSALTQARINSYIGLFQDLDPRCVHVPIIGGPDTDNVVPLLSRALPATILPCDIPKVHLKIKDWKKNTATKCEPSGDLKDCRLSEAYSINQLVTTMALGLCGDDYAITTAFIRQNIIPTCRYLVSTVQFGPSGVIHNFGIPRLTQYELKTFEDATNQLKTLEEMALKVLNLTNAVQKLTSFETVHSPSVEE
ncbi:hypothetical protein RN001_013518 [Aquatica leii]|uniref:Malate dehydrogenase, mitochondrial n=1 Tax=Aquatica leii TaxID=1421715 RepID=A0AAN7QDA0_9COLE|nr:hypothetical protein RN001_013518 [Aquatica leii]